MASETPVTGNSGEQDTGEGKSEIDVLSEGETPEEETSEETPEADESGDETDSETSEEETETPEDEEEETPEEETTEEVEDEEVTAEEAKITRPSWKALTEKYPELKKNKDFRELYFRDKAMSEVFPTVAEAKTALQAAEAFQTLDIQLTSGDLAGALGNIDKNVLSKISENILPTLFTLDKAYFKSATQPIVIDIMNNVLEYATETKDENLAISIRNVSRYLTGSKDIPARIKPVSSDPAVKQEIDKLRGERERDFRNNERKFLTSSDSIVSRKIEQIVSTDLDPKRELTDFARQAIIDRTLRDVKSKLLSDEGLTSKAQSLHKQAARDGFPDEYRSRIVSAYLDRARKLIPIIRNKHMSAALGKQQPKGGNKRITADLETKGNGQVSGSRVTSAKQIDTKKTSAEDFLADKVVLRK